jgi:hypothetical protein
MIVSCVYNLFFNGHNEPVIFSSAWTKLLHAVFIIQIIYEYKTSKEGKNNLFYKFQGTFFRTTTLLMMLYSRSVDFVFARATKQGFMKA